MTENELSAEITAATECYDILRDAAVSMELSRLEAHEEDFQDLVQSSVAAVQDEVERFAHYIDQRNAALFENEEKDKGNSEDISDDHLFAVLDIRHIVNRGKRKWYLPTTKLGDVTGSTRLTKKKGLCVHGTAVKGGFGIHKSRLRLYTGKEVDWAHWAQQPQQDLVPAVELHMLWARAMALSHRYWGDPAGKYNSGVPYHAISGANSVLYLNLPFDWVTWHGDGSNTHYLGYALDFHSGRDVIEAVNGAKYHPEDLIKDLKFVILKAREEGHDIEELTCHCAWTNKPNDPGKAYIEQVLVPAAAETGCFINYDFKVSRGRSISEVLAA
jgi:hypothetical protein